MQYRPGLLEKFGLYYLRIFQRDSRPMQDLPSDHTLHRRIRRISWLAIVSSALIGALCVYPMIWADLHYASNTWWIHYGIVAGVTLLLTLIEFYFLFLIALKAVHELAETLYIHNQESDYFFQGPFSILNILSRTALEIQEPEMEILGINPFEKVSKRNLLVLGILYKLKILISNLIIKYGLLFLVGQKLCGISILYEAILVEIFWNALVIRKVILEARLRLMGFVLANTLCASLRHSTELQTLSASAKEATLRAIGNTVVLTRNYHPNMIILLLEFREVLDLMHLEPLDDWSVFLQQLNALSIEERNFVLDVLTVAAAFDGRLSDLELEHLKEAYQNDSVVYLQRLHKLQLFLTQGKLHAARSLCNLDFKTG